MLVNNHVSKYNSFLFVLYRRYINYVSVCPPPPPPTHTHFLAPSYATVKCCSFPSSVPQLLEVFAVLDDMCCRLFCISTGAYRRWYQSEPLSYAYGASACYVQSLEINSVTQKNLYTCGSQAFLVMPHLRIFITLMFSFDI